MKKTWLIGATLALFWGAMTALLIRANLEEGGTPFSAMPPALVAAHFFKGDTSSQLGLYDGLNRLGAVTITPTVVPQTAVAFDGTLSVLDEKGRRQPINFSLNLLLKNTDYTPESGSLRIRRREPALAVFIETVPERRALRYEIKSGDLNLGTQEIPLNSASILGQIPGISGLPLPTIDPATALQNLHISARRSTAIIRDERLDVSRLIIEAGGFQATVLLGQLGEIFMVRTNTNYSLLADGLDPAKYLR